MITPAITAENKVCKITIPIDSFSTIRDIKNTAIGQYTAEKIDARETYFDIARITIKIAKIDMNTFGSIMINEEAPASTPFPPLKP